MLSNEEKREMLEDAKSKTRRRYFRLARKESISITSLDDYISFLNSVQKIFAPYKISKSPTPTKFNKL